jgi:hypothetical protein
MVQGDFYIDWSSFAQGHQDRTGQLIRAHGPAPSPAGHDDLIPVPLG